jgi:hypothetical protein
MVGALSSQKETGMFTRVVRFTDVQPQQIDSVLARINESGGPPPGVSVKGLYVLHDPEQRTAVVLQVFETAAEMEAAAREFGAMDAAETPGTRASVDSCEVKFELTP